MTRHEMPIKNRVSRNVDVAIAASGFSGAEVARRLGLNEKTVRRWRSGEATPDLDRLSELAAVLNLEDPLDFYREPEERLAA